MTTTCYASLPSPALSLVDASSSSSQAVRIPVFWRNNFGKRAEGGEGFFLGGCLQNLVYSCWFLQITYSGFNKQCSLIKLTEWAEITELFGPCLLYTS